MPKEPVARGAVTALSLAHRDAVAALEREALSILRGLDAPGSSEARVPGDADYVMLIVEEESPELRALPDLRDRAATVVGVASDAPAGRAAIARARKLLRGAGAVLGARELLLRPEDFGYLGIESDGLRERLEILLRALVNDAERLRLRREGWEEPEER